MKKVIFTVAGTLLMAAVLVSCGNKSTEETADSTVAEAVEETAAAAAAEATPANAVADNDAMYAAAKEAGRAKCECYKKDAASVESCIRSIINAKYAEYSGNEEFLKAMNAEYESCIAEKVKDAAEAAGSAAVKEGSKAISNVLNKKK